MQNFELALVYAEQLYISTSTSLCKMGDYEQWEALQAAIHGEDVEELKRLVSEGLDLSQKITFERNLRFRTNGTPFDYACLHKRWISAEFLLDLHMTQERWHFRNALFELRSLIQNLGRPFPFTLENLCPVVPGTLLRIMQKISSLIGPQELSTMLCHPNVVGNPIVMQVLIDSGADVRLSESQDYEYPLLQLSNPSSMKILLQNGANPNFSRNGDGRTPIRVLHETGMWRDSELQRCLRVLFASCENLELDQEVFANEAYRVFRQIQSEVEYARARERKRKVAFLMGGHPRLGNGTTMNRIPSEISRQMFNKPVRGFDGFDAETLSAVLNI